MKAMILAAGYGTRLRPYTNQTPKPLFSIAGRPLLDRIIHGLQKAGCTSVIINTHHLHQQIEAFVAAQNYSLPVCTRYEPQILGTGGALKNVADFWENQPLMVINADIVADIDLKDIYRAHCRHHPTATLVLCDDARFNTVAVRQNKWITGFGKQTANRRGPSGSLLTFTGIQVLEPEVLKYIPAKTAYSSIDAFKKMIADGHQIRAFIAPEGVWHDIGSPQRYQRVAVKKTMRKAFELAFGVPASRRIQKVKLKGDGSQRQWYRLTAERHSLIMADHGIRQTTMPAEVDAFVKIGGHLYRQGVHVPKIYFYDTFAGLVLLEDLGDVSLQQAVKSTSNQKTILDLYKSVIEQLIWLSIRGAEKFSPSWTYQTSDYDQKLILEKECRYFLDAFVNDYLGINTRFENLEADFISLSQKALAHSTIGFMHRDMQSRNIMVKEHNVYFIDFQGGRNGPIQYDLASLLIDPYVELPVSIQTQLLNYSIEKLSAVAGVIPPKFRLCYHYCKLTRNLQILGAFAYLSKAKSKKHFEQYIPAALKSLKHNLAARDQGEFPRLNAVVQKACNQLKGV
ncbi:MAG: phosphotransferase [Desulfobacterales bacterium]|nr:phosphotransferase [Desulfobacterales bacterium]